MSEAHWESIKNSANADMKQGHYAEALLKYEDVLSGLESVNAEANPELCAMLVACLNNSSMAYLHLQRYEQCVITCTRGLNIQEDNLKVS